MIDFLDSVIQTNLGLYFRRLSPAVADPKAKTDILGNISKLTRHISDAVLNGTSGEGVDISVLRLVFCPENALPKWFVKTGTCMCGNNAGKLEASILALLDNPFYKRRFLDYVSSELDYFVYSGLDGEGKKDWRLRRVAELCDNKFNIYLNTQDYVVKLDPSMARLRQKHEDADHGHWNVQSLGTVSCIDFAVEHVYKYLLVVLEKKYKKEFIPDIFKKLFREVYRSNSLERWGVLVMSEVPKLFSLTDFHLSLDEDAKDELASDASVQDFMRAILNRFDNSSARLYPEARFRLGSHPPREVVDKIGAIFWLRKTLDMAKVLQQKTSATTAQSVVGQQSYCQFALKKKTILYIYLCNDALDSRMNPCVVQSKNDQTLILQSPMGNVLNDASPGQKIFGYYSVAGSHQKMLYYSFNSEVITVARTGESTCLIEVATPYVFDLTRRRHSRIAPDLGQIQLLEVFLPPEGFDWEQFRYNENILSPLFTLPDAAEHVKIKDLSAGGLMLEAKAGAISLSPVGNEAGSMSSLAVLCLAGRQGFLDLQLFLRMDVKRVSTYKQKNYIGFQFTEFGEFQGERCVRWSPVGKDGIYQIHEWIFHNTKLLHPGSVSGGAAQARGARAANLFSKKADRT